MVKSDTGVGEVFTHCYLSRIRVAADSTERKGRETKQTEMKVSSCGKKKERI